MCRRIEEHGWSVRAAAEAAGLSEPRARQWLRRWRAGDHELADRRSGPVGRHPRRTDPEREAVIAELRGQGRMSAVAIAEALGMPERTVRGRIARLGLSKLAPVAAPEPANRYERPLPGELIHIDVKKLGRIGRAGHRVNGDRRTRSRGIGWEYVHVCVDDCTRLAYVEVLDSERTAVCSFRLVIALSWSGGKDSALALRSLGREQGIRPTALVTTVAEDCGRVSGHGVRRELVQAQADAVGLPLVEIAIPALCPNDVYEARTAQALARPAAVGIAHDGIRRPLPPGHPRLREERLATAGWTAIFPLWRRDPAALAREVIEAGFQAVLVCVDPSKLDASFAGRAYDESLLADLPALIDPCGENGEFHTFVHAGPIFDRPIPIKRGETVRRDGFVFCDVLPA